MAGGGTRGTPPRVGQNPPILTRAVGNEDQWPRPNGASRPARPLTKIGRAVRPRRKRADPRARPWNVSIFTSADQAVRRRRM